MKKVLFAAIMLCCSAIGFSQEEATPKGKDVVFVEYFTGPSDIEYSLIEGLRHNIMEGILKTDRVTLKDADSEGALRVEKEKRQDGSFLDDAAARQQEFKNLGANYIINGHVSSMTASKSKLDNGSIYYSGAVTFTLKVVDPSNGSVKFNKSYTYSGLTGQTGDTPEAAINNTAANISSQIEGFVDASFKIEGTILSIEKAKKDKAEEVYINLGSLNGVSKGQRFKVCIERMIANRTARTEIGSLQVMDIQGDDITLCEVKKGDAEIMKAFNEYTADPSKPKIIVESDKASSGKAIGEGFKAFGKGLLK